MAGVLPDLKERRDPSAFTRGGVVLIYVLLACLGQPSSSNAQADTEPEETELALAGNRAILMLTAGDQPPGEVEVLLRNGDIVVPVEALNAIGVAFVGVRETIEGVEHVSLASIVDDVLYSFNESELILRVESRRVIRQESVIDLRQLYRPENVEYRKDASAFLNYAGRATNFKHFDAAFETGISVNRHLLFSNFTVDRDGDFVRGLSNLTFDFPDSLLRITLGRHLHHRGRVGR